MTETPAAAQLPEPIIVVRQAGDIRIHTLIASFAYNNIANATHIIESRNALVLIDGQFLKFYANRYREYARSLGKPIERLYVSHRHPDHWFGLAAFSDIPTTNIHALAETLDFIRDHGEDSRQDHLAKMGDQSPDRIVVPGSVATPGPTSIDGVPYVLGIVTDTEIDFHLTIELPGNGVFVLQDLIYSGTHLYLTKDIDRWIDVLAARLRSDYEIFLAGHGLPADKNEVARNVEYLSSAKQAMDNGLTNEAFKAFLIGRYPERKCPAIFDIYMPRLFSGSRQY